MQIHIIAGTFDDNGGKSSGVARQLSHELDTCGDKVFLFNGGYYSDLSGIIDKLPFNGIILWFADVPNDKPKLINDIKSRYPKAMLVSSKRKRYCRMISL